MASFFQRVDKKEIKLEAIEEIVVAGDVGCTGFYEDAKIIFDRILRTKTDLFLLIGDLVQTAQNEEFAELIDFCNQRVSVPVFALSGNHDFRSYAENLGFSTYALIFNHVVSIFLDNSSGRFPEEDLGFLKSTLEKYARKKFIIFFHVPAPLRGNRNCMAESEWQRLRAILDGYKERIECLISAHIHGFYEYRLDGYRIVITAGGGSAMIHDLPEEFKVHNYLKLTLHEDGSIDTRIKKLV